MAVDYGESFAHMEDERGKTAEKEKKNDIIKRERVHNIVKSLFL